MEPDSHPTIPWRLLRRVSRSFALTLEFLPREIREPLSLAYLLARLSDTEADGAVTGAEAELLRRKSEIEALLEASPDRPAIRQVWATIRQGQAFDASRFTPGASPLTSEELDRYAYLVAGCVGEFWTRLCGDKIPDFALRPLGEMVALGVDYGKGLQLVNILRDRHADRTRGRVYVSTERFAETLAAARNFLASAARYCSALRPWRLRAATTLPSLLARRTLDSIERNPDHPRIKVSKATLWVCVLRAISQLPSAGSANEGSPP